LRGGEDGIRTHDLLTASYLFFRFKHLIINVLYLLHPRFTPVLR